MRIGNIDTEREVLIVAEIGNNHGGSYARAEEMIGRAAEAGASAVKFQTFHTEDYVSRSDIERFNRLKSFELTEEEFARLAGITASHGLLFISTPFDLASVECLSQMVSAFKIASGDNNFYPLIRKVAESGKPVIVSTGVSDLEQTQFSHAFVRHVWRELGIRQDIALLHCVASYPVVKEEANLGAITELKKAFGCCIGYSDHTLGTEAAVLAVALGARIIEKHFTLDKYQSDFRDHQISADPNEMAELVKRVRMASVLIGTGTKVPQGSEKRNESSVRRSIVAARDLEAGTFLTMDDLTWTRPAGGLMPGDEYRILGRRLRAQVRAGQPLQTDMLD